MSSLSNVNIRAICQHINYFSGGSSYRNANCVKIFESLNKRLLGLFIYLLTNSASDYKILCIVQKEEVYAYLKDTIWGESVEIVRESTMNVIHENFRAETYDIVMYDYDSSG